MMGWFYSPNDKKNLSNLILNVSPELAKETRKRFELLKEMADESWKEDKFRDDALIVGKTVSSEKMPLDIGWKIQPPEASSFSNLRQKIYQRREVNIKTPPGLILNTFAKFLYNSKTYNNMFQPTIQNMYEEYFDAIATEQKWKARWVCVRGYFSFFSAMVAHIPLSGLQLVKKIWTIVG